MSTRAKAGLVLLAICGLGLLAILVSDEFTRAKLAASKGFTDDGSRFGVRVGMARDSAAEVLTKHGYRLVMHDPPERLGCPGQRYGPGEKAEIWFTPTPWQKRGAICIVTRDGAVDVISWDFSWDAP